MPRGEGIKKIDGLFDKYKKMLRAPQGVVVEAFVEVVNDLIGVEIPKERITYTTHSKTLSLAISGPLKSEILLNKDEIITHMKGRLGAQSAPKNIM
jgi:hypothetical protein